MENYFKQLNDINVNGKTEKKGNLTYLSWAYAWGEVKKLHPDAFYTIYENKDGWFYHTDGRTCWVKTGVTVNGLEHIEYLPVMDNRNNSIPLERVTSRNVNDSIQRSLTKACARHGLGLYIYAGEDLPESVQDLPFDENEPPAPAKAPTAQKKQNAKQKIYVCEDCGHEVTGYTIGDIEFSLDDHLKACKRSFNGHVLCYPCAMERLNADHDQHTDG